MLAPHLRRPFGIDRAADAAELGKSGFEWCVSDDVFEVAEDEGQGAAGTPRGGSEKLGGTAEFEQVLARGDGGIIDLDDVALGNQLLTAAHDVVVIDVVDGDVLVLGGSVFEQLFPQLSMHLELPTLLFR